MRTYVNAKQASINDDVVYQTSSPWVLVGFACLTCDHGMLGHEMPKPKGRRRSERSKWRK